MRRNNQYEARSSTLEKRENAILVLLRLGGRIDCIKGDANRCKDRREGSTEGRREGRKVFLNERGVWMKLRGLNQTPP